MSGTGRRPSAVRSYLVAARIGVGIAFVAPILWFVARYWWAYRTTDGIPTVLAQGMIAGIAATIEYALTNPAESLLYSIGMYLLWIFAVGRNHHHRKCR
ncbi:hypothetical protein [Rhodococcus ruber]|uniref:hypothetical protein n=1 Tax=Rhodococcus ruber TaxID=1830 RepID=UPI000C7BF7E1|nr:hypothetical protein [Rhodococcus ruber]AUM20278.1 hypothetical protein CSW53_27320 [Rhodococcus ruber]